MSVTILSIRRGRVQRQEGTLGLPSFLSAFHKRVTDSPVRVTPLGLEGDEQADRRHHGGADKALCVFTLPTYQLFPALRLPEFGPGDFGENLTLDGQTESEVCIGDRYRLGEEVVVEVTQPRSPCWKLAQIHRRKQLALEVQTHGTTGWYLRVVQSGFIQAGQEVTRLTRPYPELTVEQANRAAYQKAPERRLLEEFIACPALSEGWRDKFRKRLAKVELDHRKRLFGSPQNPE